MIEYLLIINAIAFILMLLDKNFAKREMKRIPESTLLVAAILGGSLGAMLGMYACRHKTRHKRFVYGLPAILGVQLVLLYILR